MPEQSQPRRRATARKDDAPAAEEKPAAKAVVKEEPEPDERIGRAVPPHWDSAGFEDGRQYRCEDGRIVERIN